jgi:hypothetical protein
MLAVGRRRPRRGPATDPYFRFSGVKNFTQLAVDIAAVSDGGTVDLGGYLYEPDDLVVEASSVPATGSRTITNGGITNSKTLTWAYLGDGVWASTDVDPGDYLSLYGTALVYFLDTRHGADDQPMLSQTPSPPSFVDEFRMTWNSNWIIPRWDALSINKAIVHTTLGDDNTSGDITGFTTTDTGLATQITDFTDSRTAADLAIIYRAADNRISSIGLASVADAGSGNVTVTFDSSGLGYRGYLQFAFLGDAASMQSGEYSWDFANNRILYKPSQSGDPASYARAVVKAGEVIQVQTNGTIDNCRVFGQFSSSASEGAIRGASGVTGATVSDCDLRRVNNGIRVEGDVTVEDTTINWSIARLITVGGGSTIRRNVLSNSEGNSAILLQAGIAGEAVAYSQIVDNAFSMPSSAHGQAISAYGNSWQNLLIEHNLLYNVQRALAYQPNGTPNGTVTGMTVRNNLSIWDAEIDVASDGQYGFAFNGDPDTATTTKGLVLFEHNTVVADMSQVANIGDADGIEKQVVIQASKLLRNDVTFRGNLAFSMIARDDGTYPIDGLTPSTPDNGGTASHHNHWFSATGHRSLASWGQSDIASTDDVALAFNFSTNSQTGTTATGAIDSGVIGHRWQTNPTNNQVQAVFANRSTGWATDYAAASMPDYSGYSLASDDYVVAYDDKRS